VWPDDGSEYITGWKVYVDTREYLIPVEDIIHVRDGIDPRNDRLGISALKSCVREICTINEEAGYTAAILKNPGVPALMITPDDDQARINKQDADQIRDRIRDNYGGDRRGETVVLSGKAKVERVGYSPEQLALHTIPERATARIGGAIGVAPMSMGLP